ncbi:MAG: cytochrome c biogenesis protein CcsA [Desulfurococcales archaeon]|nr:cytochrome c biogenesis protein CcsA [Desulfurococcales archaeon]
MDIGFHYAVILPYLGGVILLAALLAEISGSKSSRQMLKAGLLVLIIGWFVYMIPFARLDYTLEEVARNANNDLPFYMRLATSWSSGGGSLYLYTTIIAAAFLYAVWGVETNRFFRATASAITLLALTSAALNGAFDVSQRSIGGFGLNPLLKNYWIVPHPLTTFGGFALLLAGALIVLLTKKELKGMAVFMAGWGALTFGIMFGAIWSYETFGWGGYWAWDPVETAELSVWLTATAALHMLGPLNALRRPFLYLTVSSALLAPFVTRSGLSPLHSFAAAELGSAILYAGASIFLVLAMYELALKTPQITGELRNLISLTKKDPAPLSITAAGASIAVMAFFVYASLYLPSTMVTLGRSATLPTMAEGVKFYHPVLYPLMIFSLIWLPGYFLAREIGTRGLEGFLATVLISSAVIAYAVKAGTITPLPSVAEDTNIKAGVGITIASLAGGVLLVSLIRRLLLLTRGRIGRSKIWSETRDSLLKLLHTGIAIAFIGVLLSGSYAFSNSYFQTVNVPLGEDVSVGPVNLTLENYQFTPHQGTVDLKDNLAPTSATRVLARNGLAFLSQDLASAVNEILEAKDDLMVNQTLRLATMIASLQNQEIIANSTIYHGNISLALFDVTTNEETQLYEGQVENLTFDISNATIRLTPQFGDQGNLLGAWLEFYLTGGLNATLADEIESGVLNFHRYLEINLTEPIVFTFSNITVKATQLVAYLDPNQAAGEVVLAGDHISIEGIVAYVYNGTFILNGTIITCPFPMERGVYLYYLIQQGQATILSDVLNSNLASILSNQALLKFFSTMDAADLPLPANAPSGVSLDLTFRVQNPSADEYHTRIRFEANGEASGIHGLVTPALIIRKGISDIYINVQPPLAGGYYDSYHEPLVYYLSIVQKRLPPDQALAVTALMASGYKIAEASQIDSFNSSLLIEQTTVDLYLLAENYTPANSSISTTGIYVMYKIVPGTVLIWSGVSIMGATGLVLSLMYWFAARREAVK